MHILPVADVWILSGEQVAWAAERADAIGELVENLYWQKPDLVLTNPAYRQASERIAAALHESFVDLFGADVTVAAGAEIADRYEDLLAHYADRVPSSMMPPAWLGDRARSMAREPQFVASPRVALISHPAHG